MEEHLEKFLVKVGIPEDIVSQFKDVKEDSPPDVDQLASEWKQHQREVFQNDPEIIKNLKSELRGKERGTVERAIMRSLGITAAEAREHGLEEDYEKLLKYASDKLKKSSSQTAEELQKQLQEANQRVQEYDDKVIPELKAASKKEISQFYVKNYLGELISEAGDLVVKPHIATTVIDTALRSRGLIMNLNDDGNGISIKTKDGLTPQNDDKTKNLSNKELIQGILEKEGLLRQSKGDPGNPPAPPKPSQTSLNDDVHARMPHLKKAQEHEKNVPRWVGRGTAKFKE